MNTDKGRGKMAFRRTRNDSLIGEPLFGHQKCFSSVSICVHLWLMSFCTAWLRLRNLSRAITPLRQTGCLSVNEVQAAAAVGQQQGPNREVRRRFNNVTGSGKGSVNEIAITSFTRPALPQPQVATHVTLSLATPFMIQCYHKTGQDQRVLSCRNAERFRFNAG